ncbi:hypothetical protein OIU79_006930 [Salix purpurea]|uniref:Uncharacterized protein n=1 Tax=Salix purpurea TaxID=77065 RepID=A0A9Q0TWK6_SALPP|nr:hypothetical protein OIU79_006930 [Salix purpurea]
MINIFSPFPLHNPIKISIPIEKIKKFLPSLILVASFVSLFICFTLYHQQSRNHEGASITQEEKQRNDPVLRS